MAARLTKFLNTVKPVLIAVAGYDRPEMRAALRWARRHQSAAILMSETKYDDRRRSWWRMKLASLVVRQAQAALVSGSASGEYLVTLGMPRERIFRQYGTVENDFFRTRAAAVARDFDRFDPASERYFVVCCRLIEQRKNLLMLLEAYRRYRSQMEHDPWRLVICGDGPDRDLLEHTIRERSIKGVELAGFKQPAPWPTPTPVPPASSIPQPTKPGGWSSTKRWRPGCPCLFRGVAAAPSTSSPRGKTGSVLIPTTWTNWRR